MTTVPSLWKLLLKDFAKKLGLKVVSEEPLSCGDQLQITDEDETIQIWINERGYPYVEVFDEIEDRFVIRRLVHSSELNYLEKGVVLVGGEWITSLVFKS